jgi:hypothetical protein
MTNDKYNEVSLERAYDFLLDMDTIYTRHGDDTEKIARDFKKNVLTKYNAQILPDLVDLLFEKEIPQRIVSPEAKDKHRLMRLCYSLRKFGVKSSGT